MTHAYGKSFRNINLDDLFFPDKTTGQALSFSEAAEKKMREALDLRQSSTQLKEVVKYDDPSVRPTFAPKRLEGALTFADLALKYITDLIDSFEKNEDEENFSYVTSEYAKKVVNSLLKRAYASIDKLVNPLVGVDGQGGLKLNWRNNGKEIRLSIPGNSEKVLYLYYRGNGDDGIIDNPSAETLSKYLAWLNA